MIQSNILLETFYFRNDPQLLVNSRPLISCCGYKGWCACVRDSDDCVRARVCVSLGDNVHMDITKMTKNHAQQRLIACK